jgi:antibiotic biosynthesis monooxygenase (ABM) superfamily enzyme
LAGSKTFGGLNRRLKEKTAESRWFETTGQAPFGRAKAAYWKINIICFLFSYSLFLELASLFM